MSSDAALIEARGLRKSFRRYPRFRHRALELLSFGRIRGHEVLQALDGVDLKVGPGEAVAILGGNGSGKSSLLRLLAGVGRPQRGQVLRRGRVAALLELGAGFHPHFHGRDNAMLQAALHGLDREACLRALPGIEAFAGLGAAFERPMREWSTGMIMRLAFASALAAQPDVLLVDEALAVGDQNFQARCFERIQAHLARGGALVLVTHDLGQAQRLCTRALWLEQGRPVMEGDCSQVCAAYQRKQAAARTPGQPLSRPASEGVFVLGMGRSGTSLVAQILGRAGLNLGPPEELWPADGRNVRGYHEHIPFLELNDRILALFGGGMNQPPDFPLAWTRDPRLEPYRAEARRVLADLAAQGPWVCKDPRLCLLLPFWREMAPAARFIVCLRDPLSVGRSAAGTDAQARLRVAELWARLTEAALLGTQGAERLLVFYDDLMRRPREQEDRLRAFCGLGPAAPDQPVAADPALRHHGEDLGSLLASSFVQAEQKLYYVLLRSLAGLDGVGFEKAFEAMQARWAALRSGLAPAPRQGPLPPSGERFIPGTGGEIEAEHLHRYLLALELASGKDVLDLASGEGYGSALLATVAASVQGVDLDPASIAGARLRYPRPGLSFHQGTCADLPLAAASIDLVVSFETLEHLEEHAAMLGEIRRVLRPGGRLLISSPDRQAYNARSMEQNPFHVKELSRAEFEALLGGHFKHVALWGQSPIQGSAILAPGAAQYRGFAREDGQDVAVAGLSQPIYWIGLASDGPLPELGISLYEQPSDGHRGGLVTENRALKEHNQRLLDAQARLQASRAWALVQAWYRLRAALRRALGAGAA